MDKIDLPSSSSMELAVSKKGSRWVRNESEQRLVRIHAPATPYQLDHMIAYLERNPHLAMRKFQTPGSSYDPSASWEQLAEELNALWPNGAPKDAKTWKSTWYTQRKGVMRRIRKIYQARTTNKRTRVRPRKLSLRDQKILSLSEYSDEDEIKEAFLHTAEEKSASAERVSAENVEDASTIQTNPSGMESTRSDVNIIYTDEQLLEVLEGFENTEFDSIMLRRSPRVKLVPLLPSKVASILPDPCESPIQRGRSSAPAPEDTEPAAPEPVPQTELDSSSAAQHDLDPEWLPRCSREQHSLCVAAEVTQPVSKSRTRTTRNSMEAAMNSRELGWIPRSQEIRASTSAAQAASELASEPVPQTEQNSSLAPLKVTEPAWKPLLRRERSSSCAAIGTTGSASKLRFRTTRNSLNACLDAIEPNKPDSTFTAPKVRESAALKPLSPKESNAQSGIMQVTGSTPEPLPPQERNPSPAPTAIEAVTISERSQSPNRGESSRKATVKEAAAVPQSSPPSRSQEPTSAAQESPEPEPSTVQRKLHPQPSSSRPRKIRKMTKSYFGGLAKELRDTRKYFMTMAQQQNSCMEMFAKAMQQFADNEKEKNEILRTLLLNQKSQAETASADILSIVKDCFEFLKKKARLQMITALTPLLMNQSFLSEPASANTLSIVKDCLELLKNKRRMLLDKPICNMFQRLASDVGLFYTSDRQFLK